MNETGPSIEHFFERFVELKIKFDKILFGKSFVKKNVKDNLELIKEKRYVIEESIWKIDGAATKEYILNLLDLLSEEAENYQKDIDLFISAVNENELFAKEYIENLLCDRQKNVFNFAREREMSNEFILFFSLVAAYPFKEAVSDFVQDSVDLSNHVSGFCPVCGHWPGISYITGKEGKRIMACIACGTRWTFHRVKCSFCLNTDQAKLSYLHLEDETQVSAYTCDNCRRYIKVIKISEETLEFPNEYAIIDYMSSGYLDIAAMQNKYVQESILASRFDGPRDEKIAHYWDQQKLPESENEPDVVH
jgi:formate dehydrogenase maturation protein FdhE